MKQSRLMSLAESAINIGVGFGIAFAAQLVFLPLLGVAIGLAQNLAFALIMTAISIARSYLLRRLFEALHIRVPLSPALLAIAAERRRQVEVEGWTAEHDDAHAAGEMARAGACYALHGARAAVPLHDAGGRRLVTIDVGAECFWPWQTAWWKPQDMRRNLVRAGALIAAELDRSDRQRRRIGR